MQLPLTVLLLGQLRGPNTPMPDILHSWRKNRVPIHMKWEGHARMWTGEGT